MPGQTLIVVIASICQALGSLTPRLGLPLITPDGKDFIQTCNIDPPAPPPRPVLTLTWRFDTQIYKTVTLAPELYNDTLTSSDWTGHLGETLSCSVEEKGNPAANHTSNNFLGAISINPSNLTLHEGETAVLNITSTLPIVCPHLPLVLCNMQLNMSVTGRFSGDIHSANTCSVFLRGADWDPTSGTVSATAVIASVIDPVLKPDALHHVTYTVEPNYLLHHMWNNYTSEEVEVELKDEPYRTCMVTGDSHVVTATGNSVIIHPHFGDFLFLNATTKNGHHLQIQLRRVQNGRTCGIALKVDSSLVIFNTCFRYSTTSPLVTMGTNRPDDLQIYYCGDDYQIVTGDGIDLVVAELNGVYDLKISIPPMYKLGANSICTYEGNSTKDTLEDSKVSRLSRQNSLFDLGGVPFFKSNISTTKTTTYFNCPEEYTAFGSFERSRNPMSPVGRRSECRLVQPHDNDPILIPVQKVGGHLIHPHVIRNYSAQCQILYHKRTPFLCQSLDLNLAHLFIRECAEDFGYQSRGPKEILWACEDRLFGNFSNYREGYSGHLQPLESLGTVTCPSECYLHGTCVDGKCVCKPPYSGTSTCLLALYFQKNGVGILQIRGGSTCDKSKRRCDELLLHVTPYFFNANTTKSSAKISLLQEGQFVPGPLIFHVDALHETHSTMFVSLKEILQTLPDELVTGFMISLTQDGKKFNKPTSYYIYDGRCQSCLQNTLLFRGEPTCLMREDACTINKKCYHAKEINPEDKSQMCDPDRKLMQWSSVN